MNYFIKITEVSIICKGVNMSPHDSRAVSNKLIEIGFEKNINFSMMKLIKLVYFSHGWNLAITGNPLVKDNVEAWKYGPVFRTLYYSLPYEGSMIINKSIVDPISKKPFASVFSSLETKLLNRVIDVYGSLGAFQLSDLTHLPGTPWSETLQTQGEFSIIDNFIIKNYFQTQLQNA